MTQTAGRVAVSLLLLAGAAAYLFLLPTPSDDADDVVAAVDGLEVKREQWQRGLENLAEQRALFERGDYPGGPEAADIIGRYLELGESYPPEVVNFGGVLVQLAVEAEALSRGFAATDEEIAEAVATQRGFHERWMSGDPASQPQALEIIELQIAEAGGEERYWSEVVPEQQRHAIPRQRLFEAEGVLPPTGGDLGFELARDADIELSPALRDVVSLPEVMAFLDAWEQMVDDWNAEADAD